MNKYLRPTYVFIVNTYLLASGIIMETLLFEKLFNSKEMIVTTDKLIYSLFVGLIAATYFLMRGDKKPNS